MENFYHYHPLSFTERQEDLLSSYHFNRGRLVKALKEYNRSLGADDVTLSAIDTLLDPRTGAVVSGQQAGIFTGPLYTCYKVISLLKMVEKLQGKGMKVVPIFWVASEDHDFAEINHIYILNKQNRLLKKSLEQEETQAPVGTLPLDKGKVCEILDWLAQETSDTEFKGEVMHLLTTSLQNSSTPVEWFCRLLLALFPQQGLILFDPLMEGLQEEKIPFWEDLYDKRVELEETMVGTEEELQRKGYSLQVKREHQRLPFFVTHAGERQALFETTGGFQTRKGEYLFTFSQLQEGIQLTPHLITSHALTRPLLQGFLLPVLVYLGGPAEMAYHAQLKGAFEVMGQHLPLLFPRPGMTVIEGRVAAHLQKYQLHLEQVWGGLEQEKEEWLTASSPVNLTQRFEELKAGWNADYQGLIDDLKQIDPGLLDLGEKNKKRIFNQVQYLEKKAHQAHRKKNQVLLGHFQRIEESLHPNGDLQERVLNPFSFLIKYGFSFLDTLYQELRLEEEHHILFYGGEGVG